MNPGIILRNNEDLAFFGELQYNENSTQIEFFTNDYSFFCDNRLNSPILKISNIDDTLFENQLQVIDIPGYLFRFKNSSGNSKYAYEKGYWLTENDIQDAFKRNGSVLLTGEEVKFIHQAADNKYLDHIRNLIQDYNPKIDERGTLPDNDPYVSRVYTKETYQPIVPTEDSGVLNSVYFEEGTFKLSDNEDIISKGHIRYYTDSDLSFNTGVKSPTNGYIDIIGNDADFPTQGQSSVSKIEVLAYGERTSWEKLAYYCSNMTEFVVLATDECKVTNFLSAWRDCTSLTSFPLLDTSSGIDFDWAWAYCSSLTSFPQLDVSSGTKFHGTWYKCTGLTSFPLLDTSSGTDFAGAWYSCTVLTSFPQLDVSSGTDFSWTWDDCSSLTSFPLLNVSNGTDFSLAWMRCSSLTSFPLLNVSNGTDFSHTWYGCAELTEFPLLDTSKGTNFNRAWRECTGLTEFPLLDTSKGTNFSLAWAYCSSLPSCPGTDGTVTIPAGADTTDMCTGI